MNYIDEYTRLRGIRDEACLTHSCIENWCTTCETKSLNLDIRFFSNFDSARVFGINYKPSDSERLYLMITYPNLYSAFIKAESSLLNKPRNLSIINR